MSNDLDMPRLTDSMICRLADVFSLLGDPTRLKIVSECIKQPISVTDISINLDLSQPLVSHHLRLLKAARMVKAERRGKQIFYEAADQHVRCVIKDMVDHFNEEEGE